MSYNRKISGPLVTSYLFDLLDYYSPKIIVKSINMNFLKIKFPLILNGQNFNQSDNIVCVNGAKVKLCFMYKYYAYCSLAFEKVNIYKYFWFVFIVKQSKQQNTNYKFYNKHREKKQFI